jgi:drug/metabolite transporter (DMT)-like permease
VSTASTAIFQCLLAAILFGAATPASKAIIGDIHPIALAGMLYLGAAIAVLPFAFKGGSKKLMTSRTSILRLGGSVLFGGILGPVFLLFGLSLAPASSVSLWLNLESIFTAILAWMLFREHLGSKTWIAALLVFVAGVVLATPSGFGLSVAAILVAAGCLCWGFDNNFTAIIDGFTPAQITLAKGVIAGIVNLGIGLYLGGPIRGINIIGWSILIGALGYGASIVLYISGAQKLGAARSQMLFAAAPLAGAVIAWVALKEPVQLVQGIAAPTMLVGILLMISERHEHEHCHDSVVHIHEHCHDDEHHDHEHDGDTSGERHTHEHIHERVRHNHAHMPDLHHRHGHG